MIEVIPMVSVILGLRNGTADTYKRDTLTYTMIVSWFCWYTPSEFRCITSKILRSQRKTVKYMSNKTMNMIYHIEYQFGISRTIDINKLLKYCELSGMWQSTIVVSIVYRKSCLTYQWWDHLGFLPIPSATLEWDGQLGFELSAMESFGTIPGCPTNPKRYIGMGWIVGIWAISNGTT